MDQVIQIVGALLILLGFVLAQWKVWTTDSWAYLGVNLVGAAILAVLAWLEGQWGFLLLEGVWTLVTAWSIAVKLRGKNAPASAH
jgi:membrane-bound ClpP family serine protease